MARQVVLVIGERLERRGALPGGEIGIEGLEAEEVIERPQLLRRQDVRREAAQRDLGLVLEHVIGDLVDMGEFRPVDPLQSGEIVLGRLLLGGIIGVGQVIAEMRCIAQVAAEDALDRIAAKARLVAVVEQFLERGVLRPVARLRRGRRDRLCDGGGGNGEGGARQKRGGKQVTQGRDPHP
mgnify:CR=1 FL=1